MRKKAWIHVAHSFEEAEAFEERYYRSLSRKERIETVDWLRQVYRKYRGMKKAHGGTRLRRVLRIVQ